MAETKTVDQFPLFADRLRKRWAEGAARYGDASFGRPMVETVRQILEELEDVPGWLFVLWVQARVAAGEVLDLAQRRDLEEEFLRRMREHHDTRNAVQEVEWIAGCGFERWRNIRMTLAGVLHQLGTLQPAGEATKGPRGSIRDPRSSD